MNPGSRSGRSRRLWKGWEAGLRRAGLDFECAVTDGPGDAFRISRDAAGVDAVVAVGGDGTINEVLDGLVQAGGRRRTMGVLYAGTSPDFCRFNGIPTDPAAALARLVEGRSRPIDVARIAYADARGGPRAAHFGCGANVGLGPAIARFANRWRRLLGDGLGTGLGVIRALARSAPADLELEVDGERLELRRVNNLSVLKSPYLASGLRLSADLRPDDGRMLLAAVTGQSPAGLCCLLPGFYTGRAVSSDALLVKACSRVGIRAEGPVELEFDGDPRGFLPADIEILPGALDLIGASHERA